MGQPILSGNSDQWGQMANNAKSLMQNPAGYLTNAVKGAFTADPTGASGLANPMGAAGAMAHMAGPMGEEAKGLISGLSDYNSAIGTLAKHYSNVFGAKVMPMDVHQVMDEMLSHMRNADNIDALRMSDLPEHATQVGQHDTTMNFGHQNFPEIMQFLQHHMGGK
jgi:hypothetical protein